MKIAVVGCGVMGSAFARFLSKKHDIILVSKTKEKADELCKEIDAEVMELSKAADAADLIILGFKPKDLQLVAAQLSSALAPGKIIMSLLAGTDISTLHKSFPKAQIVRIMPNLALTVGKGIIGVADLSDLVLKKQIAGILEGMGLLYFLPESKMDAFTALCGSSPAFVFVILEALMEGGVAMGFTFQDARELVLQVFEGSVELMKETQKHPAELKMLISSPGGTTIAGLKEMEAQSVRSGLIQTLFACYAKSQEMSRAKT